MFFTNMQLATRVALLLCGLLLGSHQCVNINYGNRALYKLHPKGKYILYHVTQLSSHKRKQKTATWLQLLARADDSHETYFTLFNYGASLYQ